MLIALLGGAMLLAWGWWPAADPRATTVRRFERTAWLRVWMPIVPALALAAWLCGWALAEPDPVPEKVSAALVLTSVPFALLIMRAMVRAGWALIGPPENPGAATIGLLRTWVVLSPKLARNLDERQLEAALAHERAHARHRDPLRIWLAQIATDLQWPWPQAQERLLRWLVALELARDQEVVSSGIEGAELARAIVASARLGLPDKSPGLAALTGQACAAQERVRRLLEARLESSEVTQSVSFAPTAAIAAILLIAVVLGVAYGEPVITALFRAAART